MNALFDAKKDERCKKDRPMSKSGVSAVNKRSHADKNRYIQLTTWKKKDEGYTHIGYNEPSYFELSQIRMLQNKLAEETEPDEKLEIIEEMLHARWAIQRFNALEIGRLYYMARKLLPHGEFGKWCENLGLYEKSAVHNYIRIYRRCHGRPELAASIKPTILQIVCQANFPEELRDEIFLRGGVDCTVEKLMDMAAKVRSGEIEPRSEKVKFILSDIEYENIERIKEELCSSLLNHAEHTVSQLQKLLEHTADPDGVKGIVGTIKCKISECTDFIAKFQ